MHPYALANPRRRRSSRKARASAGCASCASEGMAFRENVSWSPHGVGGYNTPNTIEHLKNLSKPAKIGIAVGGGAVVLGLIIWLVTRGDKPSDVAYKGVAIHLKPIFIGGASKWSADFQWTPPGPGAKTKQISAIGSSSDEALDNAKRMIDDFVNAVT